MLNAPVIRDIPLVQSLNETIENIDIPLIGDRADNGNEFSLGEFLGIGQNNQDVEAAIFTNMRDYQGLPLPNPVVLQLNAIVDRQFPADSEFSATDLALIIHARSRWNPQATDYYINQSGLFPGLIPADKVNQPISEQLTFIETALINLRNQPQFANGLPDDPALIYAALQNPQIPNIASNQYPEQLLYPAGSTIVNQHPVFASITLADLDRQLHFLESLYTNPTEVVINPTPVATSPPVSTNPPAQADQPAQPTPQSVAPSNSPGPIVDGVEQVDRIWTNNAGVNLNQTDPAFIDAIEQLSAKYNVDPDDFLGVIAWETAGTFDPSIGNGQGYYGLLQTRESTIKSYGYTLSQYRNMSRAEQVGVIERYFDYWLQYARSANPNYQLDSAAKLYLVYVAPAYQVDVAAAEAQGLNPNSVITYSPSRYPEAYYNPVNAGWKDANGNMTVGRLGEIVQETINRYSTPMSP